MRRSWLTVASCAVLVAIGLVVGSLTTASSQGSTRRRLELFIVNNEGSENSVDVGKDKLSSGDYFVYRQPVHDGAFDGPKIGQAQGRCLVVRAEGGFNECTITFILDEGKITALGPVRFNFGGGGPTPTRAGILGGTGDYRNAGGTLLVELKERGVKFTVNAII